tara:strand:- start:55 stop:234 length:180 start_codon:yes stop_codon:yes gene_type:complete
VLEAEVVVVEWAGVQEQEEQVVLVVAVQEIDPESLVQQIRVLAVVEEHRMKLAVLVVLV